MRQRTRRLGKIAVNCKYQKQCQICRSARCEACAAGLRASKHARHAWVELARPAKLRLRPGRVLSVGVWRGKSFNQGAQGLQASHDMPVRGPAAA